MFKHTPKPATKALAAQRTAAIAPATPARSLGDAARPRIGFGDIAIHPPRASHTGLPDRLKGGIEALAGMSMEGVRVHYNSTRPKRLDALAFAQGHDIHLAAGQEHHLPHEAWHIVQQAQGRVRPTLQAKTGENINDDHALEREADAMGAKAMSHLGAPATTTLAAAAARLTPGRRPVTGAGIVQPMRLATGGGKTFRSTFSSGSRLFSSGGGGGGGKEPWRPTSFDEERKKQAEAQVKQKLTEDAEKKRVSEKLLKRRQAMTFGPEVGFLKGSAKNYSRATNNIPDILRSIDKTGFISAATRQNLPVNNSQPTDKEITGYSGVKGEKATYHNSRLIGVNKDTRHTLDVATGTTDKINLQQFLDTLKQSKSDKVLRLDDVDTSGLDMHSVNAAFKRTGQPNTWPIKGEYVSPETIPTTALRHTAVIPLSHPLQQEGLGQPGQVHPDYLRNLGLATGATLDDPQSFKIQTKKHLNKAYSGGGYELDNFIQQPTRTDGREQQRARQKLRMQKKLAAIRKREEEAKQNNQ